MAVEARAVKVHRAAGAVRAPARGGRAATIATVAVVAVALLVRTWGRVAPDRLFSTVYDESVEYQAAVRILAGSMPYENFAFVHPPGSALLAMPFAGLARVTGDAAAMASLHVFALLVGVLNALLLCLLLRRYGAAAVVAGGMAYACYFPVIAVDRTYVLEPLLNVALLLALYVLFNRSWRRSPLIAGVLLGLSMTVKVWAFADAAVLALYLLLARGRRAALEFCAGFVGATTVVCLPFFLLSPFSMVRHVVLAQAGRPEVGAQTWDFRIARLNPLASVDRFAGVGWGLVTAALVTLLVAGMLALLARDVRRARRAGSRAGGALRTGGAFWTGGALWKGRRALDGLFVVAVALLLARTLMLLLGATFYRHYLAFPALTFCLAFGILAGRVAASVTARAAAAGTGPARAVAELKYGLAVLTVVGLAALGVTAFPPVGTSTAQQREALQAWAASKDCVWGYGPGIVLSNAATPNALNGCDLMVDRTGAALFRISQGYASPPARQATQLVYRNPAWQRDAWREIERSDGVLLDPTSQRWILRSEYAAEFTRLFEKERTVSGWGLWSRR